MQPFDQQQNPDLQDPGQRLRDAFAQLLYRGHDQAVPAEAMWQQQGPQQFPPTPPPEVPMDRPQTPQSPQTQMPMPVPNAAPPGTAMPMPMQPPQQDPAPFNGRGSYTLPKSPGGKPMARRAPGGPG